MKAYITKYALTSGIIQTEGEITSNGALFDMRASVPIYYHGEGKEWHRTKKEAIARAEEMRQKKIASLKKQIDKLERMKFQ